MGKKEELAEIQRQLKINLAIAEELMKRLSESKEKIHNHEYLEELLNCCIYARDYDKQFDRFYWVNKVSKFGNKRVWDNLVNLLDEPSEMLWYKYLLFEAQNYDFDSYCLYLEKNREYKDRFYQPRRKCLMKIGLIQAIQDIIDDKIDILTISLPPGTGKLLADDTPVLTTKGWKNHGDLVVGDYVYGLDGKPKKVEYVFPKNYADVLLTFSNGEQIQCHREHEWVVCGNSDAETQVIDTSEIFTCYPNSFRLPSRAKLDFETEDLQGILISNIETVEPKQGNCIQVEGGIYCVGNTCVPTHNSTIEKFLHSAICGWFPDDYNLFYSHSGDITRMYYDGMLDILTNKQEYTWNEIFPFCSVTNTNAKQEQINIDKYKPFPNVQCTSIGAKNAGKVRASKFLLCDDLIGSIEEALNKNILDKLWNAYAVDARQRKIAGCKEIHIATRWSVHDVIGRIERMFEDDKRCVVIAVPCYDENGESNFKYDINPLTTEFFNQQEMVMDEISFRCLYMNEPIEREGLLYTEEELRRYAELPNGEPDAILGVCDTKQKGSDFLVLPCFYKYGEDYYMEDCICTDDSDYGVQYGRMSDLILEHNMQQCEFESNAGGDRVAFEVQKQVDERGGRCHITTKPTESNKETRIIVNADWIKKHCLFKEKESYSAKSDYATFMTWMLSYSVKGKNKHDDVPDALANFSLYATKKLVTNKVEAVFNPFRRSRL